MPEGGNLFIESRLLADTVEVALKDEGTGIPEEVFPKLFEPFFTTKDLAPVWACRWRNDVMTRLNGRIRAENRSPAGAAIILNFPIAE